MTTNYQKLFEIWQRYTEYDKEAIHYAQLEGDFRDEVVAVYRELTGKRTKNVDKAWKALDPDVRLQLKEKYEKVGRQRIDKRRIIKDNMESMLKNHSKTYEPKPSEQMHMLKASYSDTYRSQGYGCNTYAKGHLNPDKLLLELNGFQAEIREVRGDFTDSWGINYNHYELWANLTPYDFWMLDNGQFISVINWAVILWRKNINPKVYYPFLSYEDDEFALMLSRDPNYVITKENCMLEPKRSI